MKLRFRSVLLAIGLLQLIGFIAVALRLIDFSGGLLLTDGGTPLGGDFINLWTAGQMVLGGHASGIYVPDSFMAFQRGILDAYIGLRLWAYPPQSLFLSVPFSFVPYVPALIAWTVLGLGVLWAGGRKLGLDRTSTVLLLLSPGALGSVYFGQTGNLTAGLLMLALGGAGGAGGVTMPASAATILTIKPQLGVFVPFYWLVRRQWRTVAVTVVAVLAVLGLSVLAFGVDAWRSYLFDTLPVLKKLEVTGTGPFLYMVPSFFMALRLVTGNGDLAATLHMALAIPFAGLAIFLMVRSRSADQRQVLALMATALFTPYLHLYDMALVAAAGLKLAAMWDGGAQQSWGERALIIGWFLPYVTFVGNFFGWPVAFLLMASMFVIAAVVPRRAAR